MTSEVTIFDVVKYMPILWDGGRRDHLHRILSYLLGVSRVPSLYKNLNTRPINRREGGRNVQVIEALNDPSSYDEEVDEIEPLQTHISFVFLTGRYVYKIKKPVDFGFLDFTTLERRRFFCEEELRLNRRLCRDMYIEVVPINSSNG
ncbi:MAG: hypothetical protein V3V36_01825, partial [Candidatus Hydrothermarchaeaceae archaeon]